MLLRLRNAAASMADFARRQDQTANNLANAATAGYRRERAFTHALEARLDAEGAPRTERRTIAHVDLQPGPLDQTGNPLDVALAGEGFFVVAGPDGGARYTRAGSFTLDAQGALRTPTGLAVIGADGQPITLPRGDVAIGVTGEVFVNGRPAARLRVVTFDDPAVLQRLDQTTFTATVPARDLDAPDVRQGFVEASNVNPIREMTEMIAHFRLFEAQQKMLQSTDAALSEVTRNLGRF